MKKVKSKKKRLRRAIDINVSMVRASCPMCNQELTQETCLDICVCVQEIKCKYCDTWLQLPKDYNPIFWN